MQTIPDIVTGDSNSIAVTLKKNGEVFTISEEAEIKAALVSADHKTAYTSSAVSQSSETPGSDWDNSLVVVELPRESTENITYQGKAIMEIQVEESGKPKTWFVQVKIITGHIP